MKTTRILGSLLCLAAAVIISYRFFSRHAASDKFHVDLAITMSAAAALSFAFITRTKKIPSLRVQVLAGTLGSYLIVTGLIVLAAACQGQLAQTIMWLPLMLLYIFLYTTPLVALSWLASTIIFGFKKE